MGYDRTVNGDRLALVEIESERDRRTMPLLGTLSLLALAILAVTTEARGAESTFSFPSLERSYHDVADELAPVQQGPLTLRLRSPSNVVLVESHRVRLEPLGDGQFRGRLELTVRGGGELVGEADVAGMVTPVRDRLVLPRQRFEVPGRVVIESRPSGFAITPLELPSRLEVLIQSQLGNRLVGWCEQLGLLMLPALECGELEDSVTRVLVPLPSPGETLLLPFELLTEEERGRLEAFLGAR